MTAQLLKWEKTLTPPQQEFIDYMLADGIRSEQLMRHDLIQNVLKLVSNDQQPWGKQLPNFPLSERKSYGLSDEERELLNLLYAGGLICKAKKRVVAAKGTHNFLLGRWLEHYVASQIQKTIRNMTPYNLTIAFDSEYDIVFLHDQTVFLIEAKSGQLKHRNSFPHCMNHLNKLESRILEAHPSLRVKKGFISLLEVNPTAKALAMKNDIYVIDACALFPDTFQKRLIEWVVEPKPYFHIQEENTLTVQKLFDSLPRLKPKTVTVPKTTKIEQDEQQETMAEPKIFLTGVKKWLDKMFGIGSEHKEVPPYCETIRLWLTNISVASFAVGLYEKNWTGFVICWFSIVIACLVAIMERKGEK